LGDVDGVAAVACVGDVFAAVRFEGAPVAVKAVAVQFGDQVVVGPVAVHTDPVDGDVGLGFGELVGAQELQEVAFEL
jgi:hypothetical protein